MRVYVHIGAPKTGTTYLQQILHANRAAMRDEGVLYPESDPPGMAHHTAVWDILGSYGGEKFEGRWDFVLDQVTAWDGQSAVISSEMFVFFDAEQVRRVVTSFPDHVELHLVYTARDMARQVPAVWQERIKNRRTLPYERFRRDVLGKRKLPMSQHFWRAQDAATALGRWAVDLPPEHVHIVTAPPAGSPPALLWERFASLGGLTPSRYQTDIPPSNESLSVSAVEVLRRYNERHVGKMGILDYRPNVQRILMPALVEGIEDRRRLPLSYEERQRLVTLSKDMVASLKAARYDVVGSLDDLIPEEPGRTDRKRHDPGPDDLTDGELVDALLDVVHHLLGRPA